MSLHTELTTKEIDDLVAFMESLTDPRVVSRKAPFDHPELQIPNGHMPGTAGALLRNDGRGAAVDRFGERGGHGAARIIEFVDRELHAVGRAAGATGLAGGHGAQSGASPWRRRASAQASLPSSNSRHGLGRHS